MGPHQETIADLCETEHEHRSNRFLPLLIPVLDNLRCRTSDFRQDGRRLDPELIGRSQLAFVSSLTKELNNGACGSLVPSLRIKHQRLKLGGKPIIELVVRKWKLKIELHIEWIVKASGNAPTQTFAIKDSPESDFIYVLVEGFRLAHYLTALQIAPLWPH